MSSRRGEDRQHLFCLFSFWSRFSCQLPNEGISKGMTWYRSPCPLHTPWALKILRQLHYLQDHLPRSCAAGWSLICKPESEPARLRQSQLVGDLRAAVSLFCSCFLGPGLPKGQNGPPWQTGEVLKQTIHKTPRTNKCMKRDHPHSNNKRTEMTAIL